jgi:glucokinase
MTPTVFAADLGGTKLAAALVDSHGNILSRREFAVDHASTHAPIQQICHLAREMGAKHSRAVGVAIPGLVRRDGTVWAPNLPRWQRVPLARLLQRELRVPVAVESDRNAAVLGEAWRGAARGKSDIIVLLVGTGIGAGILSGGRLIRGAHELSGCAGWMVITENEGKLFQRIGCLEALAAGPGVARQARMRNAEIAAAAARRGNARARAAFKLVGKRLGASVANLISLFDPEVIVLSGGLLRAADLLLDELKRTALRRCQPLAAKRVKIRISRLGNRANLLGAAQIAWQATRNSKSSEES